MTVATTAGDGGDLTIGEVAKHLERVKVPVNIGGMVMQHVATVQLDDAGGWTEVES